MTASCTRSSARSKSPIMRTNDPQMRPTSLRNTSLIASPVGLLTIDRFGPARSTDRMVRHVVAMGDHRTDLDGLVLGWPALGDGDRLVEVSGVDGHKPGDVLLALHEGPVGDERAPVAPSNRRRRARRLE